MPSDHLCIKCWELVYSSLGTWIYDVTCGYTEGEVILDRSALDENLDRPGLAGKLFSGKEVEEPQIITPG